MAKPGELYPAMRRDGARMRLPIPEGGSVTLRCRIATARFGFLDRIRILFTGRVFIGLANAKEHTKVTLTTRVPVEQQPRRRRNEIPTLPKKA